MFASVLDSMVPQCLLRLGQEPESMAGMTHWPIISLLKDAVAVFAIVGAIVVIYRKFKRLG